MRVKTTEWNIIYLLYVINMNTFFMNNNNNFIVYSLNKLILQLTTAAGEHVE